MRMAINVFFFSNLLLAVWTRGVRIRASFGEYKYSGGSHRRVAAIKIEARAKQGIANESIAVQSGRFAQFRLPESAALRYMTGRIDGNTLELRPDGRHFAGTVHAVRGPLCEPHWAEHCHCRCVART